MWIIAALRTRKGSNGWLLDRNNRPISYWCGDKWGARGNAKLYDTQEEADAEPVWKYESRTWEYNIGATFHVDEEVRL